MSNRKLSFWKPRKDGGGSAVFFEFKPDSCFVVMMPQGASSKDWNREGRINVKLGLTDVGALLAVLNNYMDGLGTFTPGKDGKDGRWSGLYHDSQNGGNSSIQLYRYDKTGDFIFGLSRQKTKGGQVESYSVRITFPEAQLMRVILEDMARSLMVDTYQGNDENTNREPVNSGVSSGDDENVPF